MKQSLTMLFTSSVFVQLISFLILPLLTNFTSKIQFGAYATFIAICGLICANSALRYEIALNLEGDIQNKSQILLLSIITSFLVCTFIFLLLTFINNPHIPHEFIFIGYLNILSLSLIHICQFWLLNAKKVKVVAFIRAFQIALVSSFQITLIFLDISENPLVQGIVLGNTLIAIYLIYLIFNERLEINCNKLLELARKYINYPKYSVLENLLGPGSMQLSIILISLLEGPAIAGIFYIAMKFTNVPIQLITNNISQLYLANGKGYEGAHSLEENSVNIIKKLVLIGYPVILLYLIFVSISLTFILNDEYSDAVKYILIMSPWLFVRFLSAPISWILHFKDMLRTALDLKLTMFLARMSLIFLAFYLNIDTVIGFSVASFIVTSLMLITFIKQIRTGMNQ